MRSERELSTGILTQCCPRTRDCVWLRARQLWGCRGSWCDHQCCPGRAQIALEVFPSLKVVQGSPGNLLSSHHPPVYLLPVLKLYKTSLMGLFFFSLLVSSSLSMTVSTQQCVQHPCYSFSPFLFLPSWHSTNKLCGCKA